MLILRLLLRLLLILRLARGPRESLCVEQLVSIGGISYSKRVRCLDLLSLDLLGLDLLWLLRGLEGVRSRRSLAKECHDGCRVCSRGQHGLLLLMLLLLLLLLLELPIH